MDRTTDMLRRLGTGDKMPAQVLTFGVVRWQYDELTGALLAMPGLEEPTEDLLYPAFFFRLSGPRWQVCAKFPSGATQILATEP